MTIEEAIDSKPIQVTGWASVIAMILGNLFRIIPHMNINVNDVFLVISSIAGSVYLIFKAIIAFYTMKEKAEAARERKKKKDSDAS